MGERDRQKEGEGKRERERKGLLSLEVASNTAVTE